MILMCSLNWSICEATVVFPGFSEWRAWKSSSYFLRFSHTLTQNATSMRPSRCERKNAFNCSGQPNFNKTAHILQCFALKIEKFQLFANQRLLFGVLQSGPLVNGFYRWNYDEVAKLFEIILPLRKSTRFEVIGHDLKKKMLAATLAVFL